MDVRIAVPESEAHKITSGEFKFKFNCLVVFTVTEQFEKALQIPHKVITEEQYNEWKPKTESKTSLETRIADIELVLADILGG